MNDGAREASAWRAPSALCPRPRPPRKPRPRPGRERHGKHEAPGGT